DRLENRRCRRGDRDRGDPGVMFEVIMGSTSALRANRSGSASESTSSSVGGHLRRSELIDGTGSGPPIDSAYSAIPRSLENFPESATLRMALRPHPSRFAKR